MSEITRFNMSEWDIDSDNETEPVEEGALDRIAIGHAAVRVGPWKKGKSVTLKGKVKHGKAKRHFCGPEVIDIIDNYDRPGNAEAWGVYTCADTYSNGFTDKTGERVPKAGAFAAAGIGRAKAEYSFLQAEAKGPNASASAEANILGVEAMARAEIASASASAGLVAVKVGFGVDTGAKVGLGGVEVKFLGSGIKIGPTGIGLALFGNEVNVGL